MVNPKKEKRLYEVTLPKGLPHEPKREKYRVSCYSPLQALAYALRLEDCGGMVRYFKPRLGELVKDLTAEQEAKRRQKEELDGQQLRLF